MNPEYVQKLIAEYKWVVDQSLLDLIVNVVEDAVLDEREACAKACEERQVFPWAENKCAAAIRARGQA